MNARRLIILGLLSLFFFVPLTGDAQLRPPLRNLELLCGYASCSQAAPKITQAYGEAGGNIKSGQRVQIVGSGFGNAPGKVYLNTPTAFYELTVEIWHDTGVVGRMPPITGVCDTNVSIQVFVGPVGSNSVQAFFEGGPIITTAVGNVTPGGQALVAGCGLGKARGNLYLAGLRNPPYELNIKNWFDHIDYGTVIDATVPDIAGFQDSPAQLFVRTAAGKDSNSWAMWFAATRVLSLVPSQAVNVVACQDAPGPNEVIGTTFDTHLNYCKVPGSRISILSWHGGWLFGRSGTDVHSVVLKNGWLLNHLEYYPDPAVDLTGFNTGSPSMLLSVNWRYGFMSFAAYFIDVVAKGPKGVPLQ